MRKDGPMKQTEKVLLFLEQNQSVTVREAFEKLRINSPTKVLSTLNKDGIIDKEVIWYQTPEGDKNHYVRYSLNERYERA